MKIAILLLSGGIIERGAEVGMTMLAEDLASLNYQVHLFQAGKSKQQSFKKLTIHQIPLPILPLSHKPKSALGKLFERLYLDRRSLLSLLFVLKSIPTLVRTKPDIYFPVDGVWEILICKILIFFFGGKLVVSGKAGPGDDTAFQHSLLKRLRWILNHKGAKPQLDAGWTDKDLLRLKPDAFVAISPKAATWAKSINPKPHIVTIGEAIDPNLLQFNSQPAEVLLKPPIVITVAAFTPYKRIDTVIKAVAQTSNLSLLVVGQGEAEESLVQLGQKLLKNRFQLMHANYDQLPTLYTASQAFCLLSQPQEAFGRVLLEAQAAGLPIVTTDDPIRCWIVGPTGLYVNPNEIDDVAKTLKTAVCKPRNQGLSNVRRFERQTIARDYDHLFNQLMN